MSWGTLVGNMDRACLSLLGGKPVTYSPKPQLAIPDTTVTGLFDAAYVRIDAGVAGVQTTSPVIFFRLSDLPCDPDDDDPDIIIDGVTYRPTEVQKDGQGGVRIFLHRDSI